MTLALLLSLAACSGVTEQAQQVIEQVEDQVDRQVGASHGSDRQARRSGALQSTAVLSQEGAVAYFYQTVGQMHGGEGENAVRIGACADGKTVRTDGIDAMTWKQGANIQVGYGDPVFSYLPSGRWAMTARSRGEDPRGASQLLYYEGTCPFVDDSQVVALNTSTAKGCTPIQRTLMSKTSQIFEHQGESYLFQLMDSSLYLTHIGSPGKSTRELDGLCAMSSVKKLSELDLGDSVKVFSKSQDKDLRVSDSAVGRRTDGTWVLFVKALPKNSTCEQASICELCSRSVYRATSKDLLTWSALEEVVQEASVPEAMTAPDGKVWLYWQDFSAACDADDGSLGTVAPIRAAYEQGSGLSTPTTVSFPDETFEGNDEVHYATNGNPVALPDAQALAALQACMSSGQQPTGSDIRLPGGSSASSQAAPKDEGKQPPKDGAKGQTPKDGAEGQTPKDGTKAQPPKDSKSAKGGKTSKSGKAGKQPRKK